MKTPLPYPRTLDTGAPLVLGCTPLGVVAIMPDGRLVLGCAGKWFERLDLFWRPSGMDELTVMTVSDGQRPVSVS
jgi:hypothetical protein